MTSHEAPSNYVISQTMILAVFLFIINPYFSLVLRPRYLPSVPTSPVVFCPHYLLFVSFPDGALQQVTSKLHRLRPCIPDEGRHPWWCY